MSARSNEIGVPAALQLAIFLVNAVLALKKRRNILTLHI